MSQELRNSHGRSGAVRTGLQNGRILIAAYFVVTYFLPVLGNYVLADRLVSSYRIYPVTALALGQIAATFLVWLGLERVRFRVPRLPAVTAGLVARLGAEYWRVRPVVALVACLVNAAGVIGGFSGWRYSGAISSEASALFIPFIVFNVVVALDVFHGMFIRTYVPGRRRMLTRTTDLGMALALLLAANGVLSAFMGLTALLWAVFPRIFLRLAFVPPGHYTFTRVVKLGAAIVVLSVAFCAAWIVGNVIKSSSATDLRTIAENPAMLFEHVLGGDSAVVSAVAYAVERQSVHYYSLLFTSAVPRAELEPDGHSVVLYPLQTLLWRAKYLLRGDSEARPPVTSVMQLNYRLLTDGPASERAGTSPGLIAAFDYVLPPVLAVLAAALYLRVLSPRLGILLEQYGGLSLSPIGALLTVQFVGVFFQSPFDMLIVFDDGFIWAVALFVLGSVKLRQMRRAARPIAASLSAPLPGSLVMGYRQI